jgi:hypothetical protein
MVDTGDLDTETLNVVMEQQPTIVPDGLVGKVLMAA